MIPIELPSGLCGEIRKFKTGDYNLFSDRQLSRAKGPAITAALCDRLWEHTTDPGPYELTDDGKPPWRGQVIEHDRFYLLMVARMHGPRGNNYEANWMCKDPMCDARIQWTVPLDKLPVKPMSDEAKAIFKNGNRFDVTLPECGRLVSFGLPTFDIQRQVEIMTEKNGRNLTAVYAGRLIEVEGITAKSQFYHFLEECDAEDWEALDAAMNEVDFGVDTSVECECEACTRIQRHELIWGPGFFMPDR